MDHSFIFFFCGIFLSEKMRFRGKSTNFSREVKFSHAGKYDFLGKLAKMAAERWEELGSRGGYRASQMAAESWRMLQCKQQPHQFDLQK